MPKMQTPHGTLWIPPIWLCCRNEFHSPRPVLLAMQGSELRMWEGEWEFWGQQGLHVVSYNGSAAARNVIAEHELWLAPGCLDGRAPKRVTADMPHKVACLDTTCTFPCLLCCGRVSCGTC